MSSAIHNPGDQTAGARLTLQYDHAPALLMRSSEKLTILLADEDALRRDGLAAVLQGGPHYEVVAQCPDGEDALRQIREIRPDVAVVDLNLPKLHGIELVRRVRSEAIGTKVVILSGSSDDDIIREVVRAGGDGYLLKNGPARHLIDAISYVRDGGQYFSPQLRRDGLDRRILEEPARPPQREAQPALHQEGEDLDEDSADDRRVSARSPRDSRYGRGRRLRERIRDDAPAENLEERDYEILDMMAEGIRPILDRLEEIETRIGDMESGEEPVPGNVRGWLDRQMVETFRDTRSGKDVALGRTINDLEARLPQMIEEAVTNRFQNMASKLQQDIEETHLRTLETFVKNIQVKLVQRVAALETDMSKQAEAMNQLREYSQRTEDNLSRLITGVDKLAQELPKRLNAPTEPIVQTAIEPKPVRRRESSRFSPKIFWMVIGALALVVIGIVYGPGWFYSGKKDSTATAAASNPASAPTPAKPASPLLGADTKTKMQAAEQYTENKDYALAEDIYKQILKAEPNNVDAMKALASVLYREDKIEESAAILEKLPHTN